MSPKRLIPFGFMRRRIATRSSRQSMQRTPSSTAWAIRVGRRSWPSTTSSRVSTRRRSSPSRRAVVATQGTGGLHDAATVAISSRTSCTSPGAADRHPIPSASLNLLYTNRNSPRYNRARCCFGWASSNALRYTRLHGKRIRLGMGSGAAVTNAYLSPARPAWSPLLGRDSQRP